MNDQTVAPDSIERHRVDIRGTVQGVGFRPFVVRVATEFQLTGRVGNDTHGVWCELQGPTSAVMAAIATIQDRHPPLAVVDTFAVSQVPTRDGEHTFAIVASTSGAVTSPALVPADVATCSACRSEVFDPADRRAGYAFTCCTDCGPRFTVVESLPYDRRHTTLRPFALCAECQGEYDDPGDRRFQAQAVCCPECGPQLRLVTPSGIDETDVVREAARLLLDGGIVALKGLGGYQLLCRADDARAVELLRRRKGREEKPFAVLVADVGQAGALAEIGDLEVRALEGPEAPIVLAPSRPRSDVVDAVAPRTALIGIMLPSTPLHALLAAAVGFPLVCTSGNVSTEPIVVDDDAALTWSGDLVDGVVTHDRAIAQRVDDSVGQVVADDFQLLRRARGYTPRSISLDSDGPVVLGLGAELKSTICLATGDRAHVSPHLGDLENPATLQAFEAAIADMLRLSGVTPDLIVHDMHPEYLSSKFASSQDLAPTLAVQHHHAHLVSCLTDNRRDGDAIGVTFDGIGWGPDASAWGGEFLLGGNDGCDRAAHLATVALPGGSSAIRHPWRMAVAHLVNTFGPDLPDLEMLRRNHQWRAVASLCADPVQMRTSSMGRLFDAVAALCGVGDSVTYEGQAAIGLEQLANSSPAPYEFALHRTDAGLIIDPAPVIAAIVSDLASDVEPGAVAAGFHVAVANVVTATCTELRLDGATNTVALTGGVFQNRRLTELVVEQLRLADFDVLRHRQVPPNDGGVSLGQVVIGRSSLGPQRASQ